MRQELDWDDCDDLEDCDNDVISLTMFQPSVRRDQVIAAFTFYIHSRALFRVACSRSPLSKGSIFLQPAQDTAREQVTFYLTSSDIARGPERYGPGHFQIISVPVKSPSAST